MRQKASQQRSKQAIEKVFSPEFRNRLDAIVSFGPLTPAVMETIVEKFILQLEAQLAERRVAITLEPEARDVAGRKGLRSGLRRAAARARDPDRGSRSADRRDPLRTARRRRHGDDRIEGRQAGLQVRGRGPAKTPVTASNAAKWPTVCKSPVASDSGRWSACVRLMPDTHDNQINMSDKDREHDIPVKVVDRRWWANTDASAYASEGATTSLKPTYVEELEQKVAEKDKQIQEYLTKYRQAA